MRLVHKPPPMLLAYGAGKASKAPILLAYGAGKASNKKGTLVLN